MFDYIEARLAPGELREDSHHLGAQVFNPSDETVAIHLQLEDVSIDLTLAPHTGLIASEEQSAHSLVVENRSDQEIIVVWKKTRD